MRSAEVLHQFFGGGIKLRSGRQVANVEQIKVKAVVVKGEAREEPAQLPSSASTGTALGASVLQNNVVTL